MATFKPAYLIHGEDHGRIVERRSRLRALAETQSGVQGLELFEGEDATPEAIAQALSAMTFAFGRRFIIVDGVERWKERELDPLEAALRTIPPETTIAFFAREDTRTKAPKRLHEAVTAAGGDVSAEASVKPWELPKWVIAQARELGLTLEPDAARALIAHVGERQQRLLRELEKLALGAGAGAASGTGAGEGTGAGAGTGIGAGASVDAADIDALTAASAERRAWSLADAVVAADATAALRLLLLLRSQGERMPGLLYWMGQRVRMAHDVAQALERGQPPAQIKRELRMPARAAERLIADVQRSGIERLRAAVAEVADLELASRGGGPRGTGEDTAAVLAVRRIAA